MIRKVEHCLRGCVSQPLSVLLHSPCGLCFQTGPGGSRTGAGTKFTASHHEINRGEYASLRSASTMVNFMCHLEWATGYPGIRLNIILGVSVRVFLDEINITIPRLSKAGGPPQCEGPHPIH